MREVRWHEVKQFIEKEIKHCTAICTEVDTPEKERLIAAVELRTFERILNLQGGEPE